MNLTKVPVLSPKRGMTLVATELERKRKRESLSFSVVPSHRESLKLRGRRVKREAVCADAFLQR